MKPGYKALIIVLICLICSLTGYEYGRHKTPAKVITQTKTITVDHDVVHTVTQIQKQIVYVAKEDKNIHRVVTVDKKPTGEVVTTTTVQDNSKIQTGEAIDKTKNQDKVEDHVVYKDREVTKTVINSVRPDWIVGAMSGFNLGTSNPPNLIPGVPSRIGLGISIQKHILGPFYGGAWVNSNEIGGLQLSMEF